MGGMSSPNATGYTPSGTTPTAGGKGPSSTTSGGYGAPPATGKGPSTSQYTPGQSQTGQQGARGDGRHGRQQQQQQQQLGGNQAFSADALRKASQDQYNQYQQNLQQLNAQRAAAAGQNQQSRLSGTPLTPEEGNRQRAEMAEKAGHPMTNEEKAADLKERQNNYTPQALENARTTYSQPAPQAPQPLTQQQMSDRALDEYRRTQNQGLLMPGGLGQQGQAGQQGYPFQAQQFQSNIQQGTGALTGSPDYSSQQYNQFNQNQAMGQGQQAQGAVGSQSTGQSGGGGFMSGTGGGTTGGGGMSRGKGFRSGGAVREISEKDIKQILDALRVAREVVIKGK